MDDLQHVLARLEDAEDHRAIVALKTRYARLCDDGYDAEALAALFTEDAVWDGSPMFGRAEGHDGIVAHFRSAPAAIPWALHFTLSPELELHGAPGPDRTASGTWYLWQPCTRRNRAGEEREAFLTGTYRDAYVKQAGVWRFASVRVHARWFTGPVPR